MFNFRPIFIQHFFASRWFDIFRFSFGWIHFERFSFFLNLEYEPNKHIFFSTTIFSYWLFSLSRNTHCSYLHKPKKKENETRNYNEWLLLISSMSLIWPGNKSGRIEPSGLVLNKRSSWLRANGQHKGSEFIEPIDEE